MQCLIATLMAVLAFPLTRAHCDEAFELRFGDPLAQQQRVSRFPELSGRGLRCVAEDHQGNMWFGIRDGVVRYDGIRWRTFGPEVGLPAVPVESIVVRSNGDLVVGTDQGIFLKQDHSWQRISAAAPITQVIESSTGVLWACSKWGLIRIDDRGSDLLTTVRFKTAVDQTDAFDSVRSTLPTLFPYHHYPDATGVALAGTVVASISSDSPATKAGLQVGDRIVATASGKAVDDNGELYNSGDPVTWTIDRQATSELITVDFVAQRIDDKLRSPVMHSIYEDRDGRLWAGAVHGRLCVSDDGGETWQLMSGKGKMDVNSRPTVLHHSNGEIWIASSAKSNSLCRFDGKDWTYESLSMLTGSRYVTSMTQTTDGSVWVSGLNRIHRWQNGVWTYIDTHQNGLPGDSHRMFVAADDALWIAGFGQSAVRIEMNPDRFWSVDGATYQCTDANGNAWFVDAEDTHVIRVPARPAADIGQSQSLMINQARSFGVDDGVIDQPTRVIADADGGVVVVGSHDKLSSLSTFDGERWNRHEFPDAAKRFSGRASCTASDGRIWIGCRGSRHPGQFGGVVVGRGNDWQYFAPPNAPRYATSMSQLPDGRILVGGAYGLGVYQDDQWSKLEDALLIETPCTGTAIDSSGAAWIATRTRGILRYRDESWTVYDSDSGIPSNDVLSVIVDPDDRVWASTAEGICRFDGNRFRNVDLPMESPYVTLKTDPRGGIWVDGMHRFMPDLSSPVASFADSRMTVEHGAVVVADVHGVDPWNRTPADDLKWSARIDGGGWSPYQDDNQFVFRDLSSGNHQLHVRVRDNDWNVSEITNPMAIKILSPFWLRPWFLAFAISLFGILIWQSSSLIKHAVALRSTNDRLSLAQSQLSAQLSDTSAQFFAVCDCSPIGIFVTDTDGRVTYFNKHLQRLTGLSSEQAKGFGWASAIHAEDRDRVARLWTASVTQGSTFDTSGRFVHGDKTVFFEVISDRILSGGELIGYVGAVEDVTSRVASNKKIVQSNEKLKDALDQLGTAQAAIIKKERLSALGQMAAGVAHDVKNSLVPLMTYAELLASDDSITGKSREWAELVQLGVNDTAGIVKRLDHFYRETHNRNFLKRIDLCDLVTQVVELTRPTRKDALGQGTKTLDVSFASASIPTIVGDPTQLRAVLTNLVFNAADATAEDGSIVIRIDRDDQHALIDVIDDGVGMTKETLDRCLEPFYTTKDTGSGLGLSECHGVVRQHEGDISVSSQPGKGTRVRVSLPLAGAQSTALFDVTEPLTVAENTTDIKPRVLCIDDDDLVRHAMTELLTAIGAEVESAADGLSGLALLERSEFQMVICDQGLPGMNGLAVLKEIKRKWPTLPVVIVSGWSLAQGPDDVQPDEFIEKPVASKDLRAALERYVHLASSS
ncbi:MAG: response regulator [Pirellulaceae bacterium]|nr:response regulator [Pirellulaceae bacterium]